VEKIIEFLQPAQPRAVSRGLGTFLASPENGYRTLYAFLPFAVLIPVK